MAAPGGERPFEMSQPLGDRSLAAAVRGSPIDLSPECGYKHRSAARQSTEAILVEYSIGRSSRTAASIAFRTDCLEVQTSNLSRLTQ